ncbi:carbohydrate ABC transporter permease [Marinivivus vitaminiproducens]|uniref:carbohydrate ABC transporter permease n=1 Tax=Marinivivus vitaminiproducens TaxID=3035935 RepID=UPI0027A125FC|nr:carbohydrate ABC transporter permease [Geminicoccaceae bacterium SCSIO 64248]
MNSKLTRKLGMTVLGWGVALIFFFPVLWMLITSFKTEIDAVSNPSLFFAPTVENYVTVQERAAYFRFAWNSVVIALGSTLLCLALSVPAAYAMAFFPGKRTKDLLLWMLSTKMLPAVGVLVPIYLISRDLGLLDSRLALVVIHTLINLPIVVWMCFSFFKDIPHEILEAGRMDGASPREQLFHLLLPLTLPGIGSTALLAIILSWNEAFWSLNLTAANSGPLTAFIASFSSPEGLFWAKLSAASTMAVAPILIFGWVTQRQLVRGLTFGAVK